MADQRRKLRSSTVVLGGMGVLAAALTSCGSDPDKRCVDRDSYEYDGYKIVADKNCKSGSTTSRPARTARAAARPDDTIDAAWYYDSDVSAGYADYGTFSRSEAVDRGGFGCSGSAAAAADPGEARQARLRRTQELRGTGRRHGTPHHRPPPRLAADRRGTGPDLPPHPLPRRLPAPVLGRERVLRLLPPRGRGAGGGRRGTARDVPGRGRAHRRAGPLRRPRHHRPAAGRGGRRVLAPPRRTPVPVRPVRPPLRRHAARPRCWSTTPTRRPHWSRPPAPSGSGWRSASPAPTSGTPSTSGSSTPGSDRPPLLPPGAPLHFAHSAGDELGEDLMTVAYLEETARAGRPGHRRDLHGGDRLGPSLRPLRRRAAPLHPQPASSSTPGSG